MSVIRVPDDAATIQAADALASAGDTIDLTAGYGGETATLHKDSLTFTYTTASREVNLTLASDVRTLSLAESIGVEPTGAQTDSFSVQGNDYGNTFNVRKGSNYINAGTGIDVVNIDYHSSTADISAGFRAASSVDGNYLTGFDHVEHVNIATGSGNDTITGSQNYDTINTGAGDDLISTGGRGVEIDGGPGNDGWSADFSEISSGIYLDMSNGTYVGPGSITGIEYLYGFRASSGNDYIKLAPGGYSGDIATFKGEDTVYVDHGGANIDSTYGIGHLYIDQSGATVSAVLSSSSNYDPRKTDGSFYVGDNIKNIVSFYGITDLHLVTGNGADSLWGTNGNDAFDAGPGTDNVFGGLGADWLKGGSGADTFSITDYHQSTQASADFIADFETGSDRLNLPVPGASIALAYLNGETFVAYAPDNSGAPQGFIAAEGTIRASDVLTDGSLKGFTVYGLDGDGDVLVGSAGSDHIVGSPGYDELFGFGGADLLTGGAGGDLFSFDIGDSTPAAPDVITDFEHGLDLIDLNSSANGVVNIVHAGSGLSYVYFDPVGSATAGGAITVYGDVFDSDIAAPSGTVFIDTGFQSGAIAIESIFPAQGHYGGLTLFHYQ